jgi:hypothetical protein
VLVRVPQCPLSYVRGTTPHAPADDVAVIAAGFIVREADRSTNGSPINAAQRLNKGTDD